jgi:hypothetical protein
VFGTRERGRIFWCSPAGDRAIRTAIHGIADDSSRARSSCQLQGGKLLEGNLSEEVNELTRISWIESVLTIETHVKTVLAS